MRLLRFTVRNHKSLRDEVTFDLMRPSLKTLRPKDGDWSSAIYPVAAIFGGNATGKSAVLDAFSYALTAISSSATAWQAARHMQRAPFLLDVESVDGSSLYELEFVHEGRRHLYGFEVDREGIVREWLRDVPTTRWRTLLERDRDADRLKFHPALGPAVDVTGRELVTSRALLMSLDTPLKRVASALARRWDCVLVNDAHREARLRHITDALAEGSVTFSDLLALLRVADIGVRKVDIEERSMPEVLVRAMRRFEHDLREGMAEEEDGLEGHDLDDDDLDLVTRHLVFTHHGAVEDVPRFSIADESDGTVAWLATAVPALRILREGGILLVDEIDASLHPLLLELLVEAFADPAVNSHGAQLIFTSHESYVLSPLAEVRLEPEQVWFTDKSPGGATEVTCLADFPRHRDANIAKRYLTGRFGGVPRLSPGTLAALVAASEG